MRKMRVGLVVAIVVLFGFGLQSAIADTEVSGNITSDTTWSVSGSPYIVVGDVTVDSGVTLIIEPGVTVKLDDSLSLSIGGGITARGTVTDSILFTSNNATPQPGDWGSIKFSDTSVDAILDSLGNYESGCIVEYCRIEYGGDIPGTNRDGAIYCDYASPFISHNTITKNSGHNGGGIYCSYSAPTVTDNTITKNSAEYGAGIFCDSSSPKIVDCTISSNNAEGSEINGTGGGVYCGHSSPVIIGCTISGNRAWHSGGIHCYNFSSPTITDCLISGNTGIWSGGGISCADSSSPSITGCTISGNGAPGACDMGGGGGGILCSYSSPMITDCTISQNSAWSAGGGIYCTKSSPTITNCTISENSSGTFGGGIYCYFSCPRIAGSTISGNITWLSGGGIEFESQCSPAIIGCVISGNNAHWNGGGIYCEDSSPMFTSCTITGNSATDGGGIYSNSSTTLESTILWGNCADSGEEVYLNGSLNIHCCNVGSCIEGPGDVNFFPPNISTDPMFCDPESCRDTPTVAGDYHLDEHSPCSPDSQPECRLIGALEVTCGMPPAAITDLIASVIGSTYVTLIWTAPGDDDTVGDATAYDIRYSTQEVGVDTSAWWETADTVANEPPPSPAGKKDSCKVTGLSVGRIYYFAMQTADEVPNWSGFSNVAMAKTGISHDGEFTGLPTFYSLSQNYPNPFNSTTEIKYALPRDCQVRLEIYNLLGQEVATLIDGIQPPGYKSIRWNASSFASGVYFYMLQAGDFVQTRKLILLK